MDPLTSVVVNVARHAAKGKWGQPARLYALAGVADVIRLDPEGTGDLRGTAQDSFVPIEQDLLPPGDPAEVLAGIHWPDEVAGCVLVTELAVKPPPAKQRASGEPPSIQQMMAGLRPSRQARLTVGVLRKGENACCLEVEGETELRVAPELADDVVSALLCTFLTTETPDAAIRPTAE